MPASPALASVLHQPFAEQVAFFRQKLNLPTEHWDDLRQAAHDRAFVVAQAMKADLLADLRAAVDKAIAQGTTLETFRRDFREIVKTHGWTGWTGEGTEGGEAWRTRVIFETNLRTSYAAGRWQQLHDPALLAVRPYWRYVHSDLVRNARPLHKHWGDTRLTLPHDHPFWLTHYPPNGWGCRCRVVPVRAPAEGDATEPPAGWDAVADGSKAPAGIDEGWAYAPGASWFPDLDKYPAQTAREMVAANLSDGVFDRWQSRIAEQVAMELEKPEYAGLGKEGAIALLRQRLTRGEEYPVAIMAADKQALLGAATQVVKFSDYDAIKQAYSRMGDANFTVDAYRAVQGIMDDAELIVLEGAQPTVWFRDHDGRLYVAVIWQTQTGRGVFLKSLRFGGERDMRRAKRAGTVLYER